MNKQKLSKEILNQFRFYSDSNKLVMWNDYAKWGRSFKDIIYEGNDDNGFKSFFQNDFETFIKSDAHQQYKNILQHRYFTIDSKTNKVIAFNSLHDDNSPITLYWDDMFDWLVEDGKDLRGYNRLFNGLERFWIENLPTKYAVFLAFQNGYIKSPVSTTDMPDLLKCDSAEQYAQKLNLWIDGLVDALLKNHVIIEMDDGYHFK